MAAFHHRNVCQAPGQPLLFFFFYIIVKGKKKISVSDQTFITACYLLVANLYMFVDFNFIICKVIGDGILSCIRLHCQA